MPLFEYVCEKCRKPSELLVRGSETPTCPHCGSNQLLKQASAFAPVMGPSARKGPPSGCDASSCQRLAEGCCPRM